MRVGDGAPMLGAREARKGGGGAAPLIQKHQLQYSYQLQKYFSWEGEVFPIGNFYEEESSLFWWEGVAVFFLW